MIYLDHNATTPVRPSVLEQLPVWAAAVGNPNSVHHAGRGVRDIVDAAREQIANAFGCLPRDVVFTSGGTEACHLAIHGALAVGRGAHVVTAATEHPAVLSSVQALTARGVEVSVLAVDGEGRVATDVLRAAIRPNTALVSIMWANNETGVVQPISDLADIAHEHGALFHTDAVQAVGRVRNIARTNADFIAISGHKLGAPSGVGALVVRNSANVNGVVTGGGQERGRRGGTQNVVGVAALGLALGESLAEHEASIARLARLRDYFESAVREAIPDVAINGGGADRVPNTSNLMFPNTDAEGVLAQLDAVGICASAGSACSAGDRDPSHVLTAMGRSRLEAQASVRISLGWNTSGADVDKCLEVLPGAVAQARAIHRNSA